MGPAKIGLDNKPGLGHCAVMVDIRPAKGRLDAGAEPATSTTSRAATCGVWVQPSTSSAPVSVARMGGRKRGDPDGTARLVMGVTQDRQLSWTQRRDPVRTALYNAVKKATANDNSPVTALRLAA